MEARKRATASTGTEPPAGRSRILIVDAYGSSREGLSAALRRGGDAVDTAVGSWEAIQQAKDRSYGIAIIDVDLPPAHGVAMNGWDLARIFRAFHPAAAIILVVAEWRSELASRAEALGRVRLVEKPVNPAELRVLVKALQSQSLSPSA